MLFIPILIVSIILYLSGKRILSTILFFFFLFDGFQIIPEKFFETGMGISKSTDFALLYIIILFIYGIISTKDFIPINKLALLLGGYLLFIVCLIGISYYTYHIPFVEVIRTSRYYLFALSYFVLRRLTKEDISSILKILFCIVIFQSILFTIQGFTGIALLIGAESHKSAKLITRFYNSPLMLYFFVFYGIFNNPFTGKYKYISALICIVCVYMPLHRSLTISFILILILGLFLKMGKIKQFINYLPMLLLCVIPLVAVIGAQLASRTMNDINSVTTGEFVDIEEIELGEESTLLFRIAHFYERYTHILEKPIETAFGSGLMAEESNYTNKKFDFIVGLENEKTGEIVQLETSDIAWSNLIIRYGIIGTLIYLTIYISIMIFYYKHRKVRYALSTFLYLLLLLFTSITSNQLYYVYMLVFPLMFFDMTLEKNNPNLTNNENEE